MPQEKELCLFCLLPNMSLGHSSYSKIFTKEMNIDLPYSFLNNCKEFHSMHVIVSLTNSRMMGICFQIFDITNNVRMMTYASIFVNILKCNC